MARLICEVVILDENLRGPAHLAAAWLASAQTAFGLEVLAKPAEVTVESDGFVSTKTVYQSLRETRQAIKGHHPFLVAVTAKPLKGTKYVNLFSAAEQDAEGRFSGLGTITTAGVDALVGELPVEAYLVHQLLGFCARWAVGEALLHPEAPTSCFFHQRIDRTRIAESMRHWRLCDKCHARLTPVLDNAQLASLRTAMERAFGALTSDEPAKTFMSMLRGERNAKQGSQERHDVAGGEPMTRFNWLHLSDLHVGMGGGAFAAWNAVEEWFIHDLKQLISRCGPLDAVLFSGDLTQRASAAEFGQLQQLLDRLWTRFREQGCDPVLLPVPGNHDLARPLGREHEPLHVALKGWWGSERLHSDWFWDKDRGADYRAYVASLFAEYTKWFDACPFVPKTIKRGLLPGDFSFTLEKNGIKLGVVGLNSSYLHLDDEVREQLDVSPRQLEALRSPFYNWAEEHDFALLMTHHPPTWLEKNARMRYEAGVYPTGRNLHWFDAHVFGHMHESRVVDEVIGGAERKRRQAPSLFGLEKFATPAGAQTDRRHGYAFATIEIQDPAARKAVLRDRVVRAQRHVAGTWHFSADEESVLHEADGLGPPAALTWTPPRKV